MKPHGQANLDTQLKSYPISLVLGTATYNKYGLNLDPDEEISFIFGQYSV